MDKLLNMSNQELFLEKSRIENEYEKIQNEILGKMSELDRKDYEYCAVCEEIKRREN